MTRRPDNNLPAPSQPWARSVETDLRRFDFDARKNAQDNKNALDGINASLIALGDQIEYLASLAPRTGFPTTILGSLTSGTHSNTWFMGDAITLSDIVITERTKLLVTINSSRVNIDVASTATSALITAMLSFEVVGHPYYLLGSSWTTAEFRSEYVGTPTAYIKNASAISKTSVLGDLDPGTYTLRLRGGANQVSAPATSFIFSECTMSAQLVPR